MSIFGCPFKQLLTMADIALNDKRTINGWVMFDWANSAYFLVISTAIFPIYYTTLTPENIDISGGSISNSALYSYAVSFSYILIAILTPLFSGMADYGGKRLLFLKTFTYIGALACIAMFFFRTPEQLWFGTSTFVLATLGASGGIVFYNAYLPEIASEDMYDKVSARGYAFGYIGSVLLLILCLIMINKPEMFGFQNAALPTRIAFALVGVWWLGFAQITFARMPPDSPTKAKRIFVRGFEELKATLQKVKHQRMVMRFLLAFLFYMAGVQTVIYLATVFASKELGMETAQLILVIVILQLVAIAGAYLFAGISSRVGNKYSLIIQIAIWMLICFSAYFVNTNLQFYILAGFVGLVLGGIQSLSRATYAKLIDGESREDTTSYFSFYDVLMKLSLVGGAFIFGFVEQITGGMRNSVLVLSALFAFGMGILWFVKMPKPRPSAG